MSKVKRQINDSRWVVTERFKHDKDWQLQVQGVLGTSRAGGEGVGVNREGPCGPGFD